MRSSFSAPRLSPRCIRMIKYLIDKSLIGSHWKINEPEEAAKF
ncbi:MAG: hypothetical protein AB200_00420 [Parcubacteria bacterium C7867-005]|nr:MAG: hypothetical protein AB200_00420 [Parcubacteria bacterium C7867-005]